MRTVYTCASNLQWVNKHIHIINNFDEKNNKQ